MFKPLMTAAALALATAGSMTLPMAPAAAQGWTDRGYDDGGYDDGGFQNVGWRSDRRYRNDSRYGNRRSDNRRYAGRSQRCYDKGNGGLAIGGIAGGLAGNAIAGRGDRTLGTVLGAGVGALAGRAIDRSDGRRC